MITDLRFSKGKRLLKYIKIFARFLCRQSATGKRRTHAHMCSNSKRKNKMPQIATATHTAFRTRPDVVPRTSSRSLKG